MVPENIITLEGERIWVVTQDDLERWRAYHYEYRDIILYTELQDNGTLASTLSWRGSRTEYTVEDPSEWDGVNAYPHVNNFVPPERPPRLVNHYLRQSTPSLARSAYFCTARVHLRNQIFVQ